MAELPDTLGLREVLYGERTTPARRVRVANDLLQAGRVYDALDLFLVAGDEKAIAGIKDRAVREGLPVVLLILRRAGRTPKQQDRRFPLAYSRLPCGWAVSGPNSGPDQRRAVR